MRYDRASTIVALAAVTACLAHPTRAQASKEPPPRVEASAQLTYLDTHGNASSQSLGGGLEAIWRPKPWTYSTKAVFAQSESHDSLTARSFTGFLRAGRDIGARTSVYGRYEYLRDTFAGIDARHVLESGLSYAAIDTKRQTLGIDVGIGYLNEQHPLDRLETATLTTGGRYRYALSDNSEFVFEPRYLLPFSETGAWKYNQDVSIAAALTSLLSLKASHTLRYSNAPPIGFHKTDAIMALSLVAKYTQPEPK